MVKIIRQVILVVAFLDVIVNAQQQPPSAALPPPSAETTPVPVQMRALVDSLSGAWSITWYKVDAASEEHVIGRGEEVWKLAPGGVPFIEENRSIVNGKPAEDYAAIWWDGKAQSVHGIWCDPLINDEGCSGFTVTLDGNDIVLTGEWELHGKRFAWREVFNISPQTGLTQRLYTAEAGQELKLVEILRGTKR